MKIYPTLLSILLLLVSLNSMHAQQAPRRLEPMHQKRASQVGKVANHLDHPQLHWILEWDTTAANWDSLYQYVDTYLPNGNLAEEVAYYYNGVAYDPEHRSQYTYGFQPLADRELYSIWNGTSWENEGKAEQFYDAQGGLLAQVEYQWNGVTYDTTFADRSSYTYVFGNWTNEAITETWNSSTHQYENDLRQIYHYPTAAGWDTATYYGWDGASWVPDYRFIDAVWFNFEKYLAAGYRGQS